MQMSDILLINISYNKYIEEKYNLYSVLNLIFSIKISHGNNKRRHNKYFVNVLFSEIKNMLDEEIKMHACINKQAKL